MKTLPSLTFVAIALVALSFAVAQETGKTPVEKPEATAEPQFDPAEGKAQLAKARTVLGTAKSISARVVQQIRIVDRAFVAEGSYSQGNLSGGDRRMRYELRTDMAQSQAVLLEVCDGEYLYTRHQIIPKSKPGQKQTADVVPQSKTIKRDIKRLIEATLRDGQDAQRSLVIGLGLGGMSGIIASFENSMEITGLRRETLRERPVVVIEGQWTDRQLTIFFGGQLPANARDIMPPHVPDLARVYLDEETGFPLRMLYLKRLTERKTLLPIVTLDFMDVKVGEPLDKQKFVFDEGTEGAEDITPMLLEQLNQPSQPVAPSNAPGRP